MASSWEGSGPRALSYEEACTGACPRSTARPGSTRIAHDLLLELEGFLLYSSVSAERRSPSRAPSRFNSRQLCSGPIHMELAAGAGVAAAAAAGGAAYLRSRLHVVRWSGERKPQTVTRPLDPYERRAHVMYMAEYAQQSQFSPPPPHNLSQHRHVASQLPMACTSSLDQLGSLRCTSALRRRELAAQAERGHNCISLRFCLEFTGAHNRRACWRNVFRYGCERTCGGCANMSYGLLAVPPSARPLRESSVPPALT